MGLHKAGTRIPDLSNALLLRNSRNIFPTYPVAPVLVGCNVVFNFIYVYSHQSVLSCVLQCNCVLDCLEHS